MADYHRLNQAITSVQDAIDAIHSFLTTSGPGPAWTEDSTYPKASNAGELFLETSAGSDNLYTYFNGNNTYNSETVLQCYWVPSSSNGWGGSSGPENIHSVKGAFLWVDGTNYTIQMDLFADENRCLVVLKSTPKISGSVIPGDQESIYQVLYFGAMNSHAGSSDDPYPHVVMGNALYTVDSLPEDQEVGFFPESLAKAIGPNDVRMGRVEGDGWNILHGPSYNPPRNSRGSEAFTYAQDVHIRFPGSEESFSLVGMSITTPDVGLWQDISIGGTTHYSIPSLLRAVGRVDSTIPKAYLIVKGSSV